MYFGIILRNMKQKNLHCIKKKINKKKEKNVSLPLSTRYFIFLASFYYVWILLKHTRPYNGHHFFKGLKANLFWKILRNIKHKNLLYIKKKINKTKKKEKQMSASHSPQSILLSLLLFIIYVMQFCVKDIKVVQFKRKFHYIIL